ncbi:DNA-binding protein [Aggregatibacter actinomycetemcomitans]|uniref:DNA-binding protein n=1 Tax=Aggregatibacter actinomycetemcomitans TaxID=714 RepID=UPI0011DAB71C|nr:DNA-binding protein [Aggregatibacter actinomycetemcomitans]TYB11857.1 transcriptional regulator [Aggregatibacter actinomycetemcomitans]TYB19584.1 transcriptional regulator [Aggregatibacter actinomycetemcomitans]
MNSHNTNEWFTAEKIAGIGELPKSASNVTRRATKEEWIKRQIRGKRGVAYEYHYSSLPLDVQRLLGFKQNAIHEPVAPYHSERRVNNEDLTEVSKARFLTAISTLEEILAMTRKTMAPEAKAQMVWMIYELLSEESANEKIINLVKLVA